MSYKGKYVYKILVMGDTGVGKTSLVLRATRGKFPDPETLMSTIGAFFALKRIIMEDGSLCSLQIWDFAGQERFRSFMKNLFRGANGGIFVYDVTDPITLDDLKRFWIPTVFEQIDKYERPSFFLVGNKIDLTNRLVNSKEGIELARKYEMEYIEVSSKTGENVELLFYLIAKNVHSKYKRRVT